MDENLQFHKPKAGQAESRQTVFPITVGFPIPEDAEGVEGVETVSRESLYKDMSNPSGLDHLYEMQCYNMFNMDITKDDFDPKTLHCICISLATFGAYGLEYACRLLWKLVGVEKADEYFAKYAREDYLCKRFFTANWFGIDRFEHADANHFEDALAEVKAGKKQTHWIWYIFPQMKGLGKSRMSEYYGIQGREEAVFYIYCRPTLRKHLVEITKAVYDSPNTVYQIFGRDSIKVYSCMRLFSTVCDIPIFKKLMLKYNWH